MHMRDVEKRRLQFTVYTEKEAQYNLMYKELGQVINKTTIIQNVTYFDNISGIFSC